jgi:hypothetical protein
MRDSRNQADSEPTRVAARRRVCHRGATLVRPPSKASHAQVLELTIDREFLAARDRHLAQERIRAGVT